MKNIISLLTAIVRTDGYKPSQWKQYPPNTKYISSYIESRGGADESVFFGLQAFIKEYMLTPIIMADINLAELIFAKYGAPFNRSGWEIIVNEYNGFLPLEIQAVPEGTIMPTKNVQVQVVNTDPRLYWLTSYIETALLRGIWYPSTIASKSRKIKKIIVNALVKTSDVPVEQQIMFKLNDFGARGVSSTESAVLGGMAHLVNFWGSDTIEGLIGAHTYYNADITSNDSPLVAATLAASEHSSITSWGRKNEVGAYENMIDQFAGKGKIYACVSDSFDIYAATRDLWGTALKEKIISSGGTLVVRPDSGNPTTVPVEIMDILAEKFGYTTNSKGYKVLHPAVRVIQGDGLNEDTIAILIDNVVKAGYSLENLAFGMGGGLLQNVHRDTLKYAMKASAIKGEDGDWVEIFKDPITDSGKTSKRGRLALVYEHGFGTSMYYRTVPESYIGEFDATNILRTVYKNGKLLVEDNFETIRERAKI